MKNLNSLLIILNFLIDKCKEIFPDKGEEIRDDAILLARQKRYTEAIELLSTIEPRSKYYLASLLLITKYLIKNDQPDKALITIGKILSTTNKQRIHSQAYDLASSILLDRYKKYGKNLDNLKEALSLADKATKLQPFDTVSIWNRAHILICLGDHYLSLSLPEPEKANNYFSQAIDSIEIIISLVRENKGNAREYINEIVVDAQKILPQYNQFSLALNKLEEAMDYINIAKREQELTQFNKNNKYAKLAAAVMVTIPLLFSIAKTSLPCPSSQNNDSNICSSNEIVTENIEEDYLISIIDRNDSDFGSKS